MEVASSRDEKNYKYLIMTNFEGLLLKKAFFFYYCKNLKSLKINLYCDILLN